MPHRGPERSIERPVAADRNISSMPADLSVLTMDQLDRAINNVIKTFEEKFDSIHTRMDAADKAVTLVHDDYVRVPTVVDRAILNLKENLLERINGEVRLFDEKITGQIALTLEKIDSLANVTTQQFKSINDTFSEKDKAVSVGLSAQKESAAAQQESNSNATAKMESNFTKLLEQGQNLLAEVRRNTEIQISDIKSRLDRGEGKSSINDPAFNEMLQEIKSLRRSENVSTGKSEGISIALAGVLSVITLVVAIGGSALVSSIFKNNGAPRPEVIYVPAAPAPAK